MIIVSQSTIFIISANLQNTWTCCRFRCLLTTMPQSPKRVTSIVLACCILHNLMRIRDPMPSNNAADQETAGHDFIPGAWRDNANLPNLGYRHRGNSTVSAKQQRQHLVAYFRSPAGSVPWQLDKI